MALLQISEPGMSPAPHEQRLAVGIDLGTTNSLVATVRSGMPVVLPDSLGRPLLPSVVRYEAGGKVDAVYFPINAIISLVVGLSTGEMIEAAMVGRDGVVGAAAALDEPRPVPGGTSLATNRLMPRLMPK